MANIGSNRSPSPLSSRNFRNPETNSTTRRSFNANPFARPNSLTSPKSLNPHTPAITPSTTTDHVKRNLMVRKSIGSSSSSAFQDGKENQKDGLRSPAKGGSKNFMSPTISAASKFTPSPRKKILGEKNDVTRTWVQFYGKDSDFKAEPTTFNQTLESTAVEQKEVVNEVTLKSTNDEKEMLSNVVTGDSDFVKDRPFCCSPITSPIIAPLDADPYVPPYDPKKNFLSPRPQFLRYKPNPRIESLLTKHEYGEDDDVNRLEDSFNLSDYSSDIEVEGEVEQEKEEKEAAVGDSVHGSSENLYEIVSAEKQTETKVEGEVEHEEEKKEAAVGDSVHGSSENLSEIVSAEKQTETMEENASKPRLFTRSKTVSFLFVMFLVACFSFSFTDSPPLDLPIYKDVGFSEIYHESLKFAAFAKESFDDLVENVKQWSVDLVSYLFNQKSHFFPTHKNSPSIQFFNLSATSSIHEEIVFNRHIGTDYIQEVQEFNEETKDVEEETYQEIEVDDEFDAAEDEFVTEDSNEIEDVFVSQSESESSVAPDSSILKTKSNLEDGLVSKSEDQSEMEMNDGEIESSVIAADASDESETLTSLLAESVNTIILVGLSAALMAVSAVFYMNNIKPHAKKAVIRVAHDNMCRESCSSETSSVQKGYRKKSSYNNNNKRESMASSSDFSMGSPSYGSFTTFERIPIKGDEVMLTPIRRSSRLLKNQVISSRSFSNVLAFLK